MVKIYISPSCSSCRKVTKWFKEQKIPFEEKNIFTSALDEEELKDMLVKSENGTEDIVSLRSKIVKEGNVDFDNMTVSQMIDFIRQNPSILKRPIIIDDRRMQVGYNSEEIRTFIPRARRIAMNACSKEECPDFADCKHLNS